MSIPRPEHPRPQFMRETWLNLNGEWEFQTDNAMCGREKHFETQHLEGKITVPFCPESKLSGVQHTDFLNSVWYRREICIPESWADKRILLHFGAVDYHAFVYVNGALVGEHKGGYTSFVFDITDFLQEKDNYISVCAIDLLRDKKQPGGKQSPKLHSYGCFYTRTTGIWQTVWLEAVNPVYLKSAKYFPDTENGGVTIQLSPNGYAPNTICRATAYYEGKEMGCAETKLNALAPSMYLSLSETHLWEAGCGRLYDLVLETVQDGVVTDKVTSYFGLRSIDLRKRAFCLNGKPVFGRWVLDQGFYPEGIYTAPTDEDLKKDIVYSMQLGFNGARLHEKIFEERYLYWADKMGYLVWGEHANWNLQFPSMAELNCFLPEWMEALERDFNHPAIIGWCPFNETWANGEIPQCKEMIETVYRITKAIDKTRPVIDTSGNYHTVTDIFDVHDYEQNPEIFAENYAKAKDGILNDQVARSDKASWQQYKGEPIFISEYGGIGWDTNKKKAERNMNVPTWKSTESWGYGKTPETEAEFIDRYKRLTESILKNDQILGFCYTQLYDVEQEVNGLLTYDRTFKFNPEIFKEINSRKAAIEEE